MCGCGNIAVIAAETVNVSAGLSKSEIILIIAGLFLVLAGVMLLISGKNTEGKTWLAVMAAGIGALLAAIGALLVRGKTGGVQPGDVATGGAQPGDALINAAAELDAFGNMIASGGYAYDQKQDIFYSVMDAWQRQYGYCRLYDEAAAPLGMIIDCEPVAFEYGGKRWLIEFWKGQYALLTGCEVGVYQTERADLDIPGVFSGTFYDSAGDGDLLNISFLLKKNNKTLMKREGAHWWLTGFILGEFSNPSDLTMDIGITLKDEPMRGAFLKALEKAGYSEKEIAVKGNKVSLSFGRTRTLQPKSRTRDIEVVMQWKNRYLCERYRQMTKGYASMAEKLGAVRTGAPETYQIILGFGRSKKMFEKFAAIQSYIEP
ncbi:MAG: DUF4474 domain-containing protein [Eubacteriales bacterium]|nr:DUF4474 domain-containing protein [Eubacteriales bacterium]